MGLQRHCLEYMGFVLAVFPLKCGFIIVRIWIDERPYFHNLQRKRSQKNFYLVEFRTTSCKFMLVAKFNGFLIAGHISFPVIVPIFTYNN